MKQRDFMFFPTAGDFKFMNIAMFLYVAILIFGITYLVIMFGLLGVFERMFSRKTARKLLFIIPVIVAVIGGALLAGTSGNTSSGVSISSSVEDNYGHDEFDAEVIAEKIVKSNLKSPSTAKFCKHSEYTITCSINTWTVRGHVDAQNSFGAVIRNEFTVQFTFTNSEKYTIEYCNIE